MAQPSAARVPSRIVWLVAFASSLWPAAIALARPGADDVRQVGPGGGRMEIFRFEPPEGWTKMDESDDEPETDGPPRDPAQRGDEADGRVSSVSFEPPGLAEGERVMLVIEKERVADLVGAGAGGFRAYFDSEVRDTVRQTEEAGGQVSLSEVQAGTTSQGYEYLTQGAAFALPAGELYATIWAANADGLVGSVMLVTSSRELYERHVNAVTELLATAEFKPGAAGRDTGGAGEPSTAPPDGPERLPSDDDDDNRDNDIEVRTAPGGDRGDDILGDDVAAPYAGTYEGDGLTLVIETTDDAGGRTFTGSLQKGSRTWPLSGFADGPLLSGTFRHEGKEFAFTATLDGGGRSMSFASGKKTYGLLKHEEVVNPLDEEEPDETPTNPLDHGAGGTGGRAGV